jgi:hypothetical protein
MGLSFFKQDEKYYIYSDSNSEKVENGKESTSDMSGKIHIGPIAFEGICR